MDTTTRSRDLNQSFVLTEEKLTELHKLLLEVAAENEKFAHATVREKFPSTREALSNDTSGPDDQKSQNDPYDKIREKDLAEASQKCLTVSYSLGLSDDSSISTASLETVIGQTNTRHRLIRSISASISGYYGAASTDVRVTFESRGPLSFPVSYRVSGEDRTVLHVADRLEQLLETTKPWYNPVSSASFATNVFFIGTIILVLLLLFDDTITKNFDEEESFADAIGTILLLLVGIYTIIGLVGATIWDSVFRKFLFPSDLFVIGHGKERFTRLKFLQKLVFLTIGVGAVFTWLRSLL